MIRSAARDRSKEIDGRTFRPTLRLRLPTHAEPCYAMPRMRPEGLTAPLVGDRLSAGPIKLDRPPRPKITCATRPSIPRSPVYLGVASAAALSSMHEFRIGDVAIGARDDNRFALLIHLDQRDLLV
jgi:hypothetical protein